MKKNNTNNYSVNYSTEKEKYRDGQEKPGSVPAKEEEVSNRETFLENSLNSKFNQVRPGVFTFARGKDSEKGTPGPDSEKFLPVTSSNVPSSMSGFKKIGMSKDGLPIYTFT